MCKIYIMLVACPVGGRVIPLRPSQPKGSQVTTGQTQTDNTSYPTRLWLPGTLICATTPCSPGVSLARFDHYSKIARGNPNNHVLILLSPKDEPFRGNDHGSTTHNNKYHSCSLHKPLVFESPVTSQVPRYTDGRRLQRSLLPFWNA